ncbi:MAG: NUDIX domain-containing protein [Candidatus Woesebacteria bacterium]
MKSKIQEKLALVDQDDREIGVMEKYQVHENPPKLHRAVSVWLINDNGEVLFQKRSKKKIVGAGLWANTICGNVRLGESYKACAFRRLKEELGMEKVLMGENSKKDNSADGGCKRGGKKPVYGQKDREGLSEKTAKKKLLQLKPIYTFSYKAYGNEQYSEHEIDKVFIGKYNGKVKINPDEVSEVAWFNLNELLAKMRLVEMPDPKDSLTMNLTQLRKRVGGKTVDISEKTIELVPWTIMMAQDGRLEKNLKELLS